jgi:thiamine-phosphate pyrophosphorylase
MRPILDLRLYGVLDPTRCRGRDPVALAAAAAAGGITLLQLRDKNSATRELVSLARSVGRALAAYEVPMLINDRIDVAMAAGAQGAHVGNSDMSPDDARRLLGPAALLGVTIHHSHEAALVQPGVADYAGLGPVYPTASKDPGDLPLGPDGLARLITAVRRHLPALPVCGIAGIDSANAAAVIDAGADGVAVIADIFMAEDVTVAARRLRDAVDAALARRRA